MDNKQCDSLVNIAVLNFFTLGKETEKIMLYNVDRKDKRHLACIHIANIINQLFGFEFNIYCNFWDFIKLSWKCKSKKWLKRSKNNVGYFVVDVEDFISNIENANGIPNAFEEIYNQYFKELDR